MHAAAAVTRISRSVHAPPTTAAAAAGSLAVQDCSVDDVNVVVAEFIQPFPRASLGLVVAGGEEVDPISSESQLHFPTDLVDDIQELVFDLLTDKNVVNHVRRRKSFQELEKKLLRAAPSLEITQDVLSLTGNGIPQAIINELTDEKDTKYLENHYSNPNASEEPLNEYSCVWLRERISHENLEAFFQKLEESDNEHYDGIRLTFKRNETPGLLSLINSRVQPNILGSRQSSLGSNIVLPSRTQRRVSQGHVGSPPRERVRSAAETPSPASAVSLAQPVVAAGQVTDAVPQILILLATTILLATSLRKQGANHVVDKLIQFTRKVTSWIVAHWCRRP